MKILQINTTVNTGSTGRIAEEIGQTLKTYGHQSYIACRELGPNGSQSHLIKIGNQLDTYLHGLKTRILDRHGFGSKKATKTLLKKIKQINPDVMGLHNLHGYYINIELLFSFLKKYQKPVIWTLHDCWPFTGHCSFFDNVSCDKWKTECHDCPLSDKYPASWLLDNSRENYHRKKDLFNGVKNLTIVTPSHWLKNLVSQSFLSEYPVQVIHNGIDLKQFRPVERNGIDTKYNLADKQILLGVASVWDRRKGLKYFLDLSKQLDDSYRIILVGLTEQRIKTLPENIIGIQRTEDTDELVHLYNIADVFINPTLVDNFPTTNIEALACGTPVVTFDTGGSPEAIDKDTGITVKEKSVELLHSAILKIKGDEELYSKEKCRNRAVTLFNKEDRFRDYLKMYEEVSLDRSLIHENNN